MDAVCATQIHGSGLGYSVLPSYRKLSGSRLRPSPETALRQRAPIYLKSGLLLRGSGHPMMGVGIEVSLPFPWWDKSRGHPRARASWQVSGGRCYRSTPVQFLPLPSLLPFPS